MLHQSLTNDRYISTVQGHLTKLGSFMKNWKKRWFCLDLRKGTLVYTSDENSNSELGHISLFAACDVLIPQTPEARAHNTVLVVTPRRTYNLRADAPSIMLSWYYTLSAAIKSVEEK